MVEKQIVVNCNPRLVDSHLATFKREDLVGILEEKKGIIVNVYAGKLYAGLSPKISPVLQLARQESGEYVASFSENEMVLPRSPSYLSGSFVWELWDQIPALMKQLGVKYEGDSKLYVPVEHHILPREVWRKNDE